MLTGVENSPVLDEKVWRAWLQKSKLREQATARKVKIVGGIALGLLALAGAVYRFR
jgi:hypothetical protein